ncbi:MAG: hypothetical protein E7520_04895 [Ruminococcaceae bacterium]|nr:hypothetical protein [Oscillospiraceae bacterium]
MKFKFHHILAFITTVLFLIAPLFKSTVRYALLGATLAMCLLCIVLIKKAYIGVIFFLMAMQNALQMTVPKSMLTVVTYYDEVFQIVIVLYLLYVMLQKRITISYTERILMMFYGLYLLMCFLSSVFNNYATITVIVLDAFVCIKFFLFYRGGFELSRQGVADTKTFYEHTNAVCKIITVGLFLYALHELFLTPFFPKYDFRYFTESLQLFFFHPTYLAAFSILMISVLILNLKYDKSNMVFIVMMSFVTLTTLRTKAIAAILIIFLIYFAFVKYNLPFKGLIIIGAIGAALYLGLDQIELYFTESAGRYAPIRLKMMRDGIGIANDHFPLGAGFGTYGTTVAYDYGSSFYYNLGYMGGHYKDQPVGDVFWPGIFAEAGWIGTVFFALTVIIMIIIGVQKIKVDKYAGWCMLSIMTYALSSSTSETGFFHPAVAIMFIVYGIAAGSTANENENPKQTGLKFKIKI